jgi:hypothetical protein
MQGACQTSAVAPSSWQCVENDAVIFVAMAYHRAWRASRDEVTKTIFRRGDDRSPQSPFVIRGNM